MASRVHRASASVALGLLLAGFVSAARSADTGLRQSVLGPATLPATPIPAPSVTPRATPVSTQLSVPAAPLADPAPASGDSHAARDTLAAAMHAALGPVLLTENPALARTALLEGQAMATRLHATIDAPQTLLLVDRSPAVQRLWVVFAAPGHPWEPLGSVHVSTGKPGRKEHFRTPVGLFVNDSNILGYRALGTYNENHIRGNGVKGMRVWDFGWQMTDDWRKKNVPMAVRMEMHATDPANLELRLGHWDSEGCIRIPSSFNTFLDRQGLIDAKLREAAQTDRRFAALLPKGATPSPLAGSILLVIDSADPWAVPSDPVKANAMEHPAGLEPGHDDAG